MALTTMSSWSATSIWQTASVRMRSPAPPRDRALSATVDTSAARRPTQLGDGGPGHPQLGRKIPLGHAPALVGADPHERTIQLGNELCQVVSIDLSAHGL